MRRGFLPYKSLSSLNMKYRVVQRFCNDIEARSDLSVQMQHKILTAKQARVVD